ncbi:MAG: hypothetical protein ACI8TP_004059 [Acidimicrobiales bacterium]|jgi:hypothetical protein
MDCCIESVEAVVGELVGGGIRANCAVLGGLNGVAVVAPRRGLQGRRVAKALLVADHD